MKSVVSMDISKVEFNSCEYEGTNYTFLKYYDRDSGYISTYHYSDELSDFIADCQNDKPNLGEAVVDVDVEFRWNRFKKAYVISSLDLHKK